MQNQENSLEKRRSNESGKTDRSREKHTEIDSISTSKSQRGKQIVIVINFLTAAPLIPIFFKQYELCFVLLIISVIACRLDSIYSEEKSEKQWLEMKETAIKQIKSTLETIEQQWQDKNNEKTS